MLLGYARVTTTEQDTTCAGGSTENSRRRRPTLQGPSGHRVASAGPGPPCEPSEASVTLRFEEGRVCQIAPKEVRQLIQKVTIRVVATEQKLPIWGEGG